MITTINLLAKDLNLVAASQPVVTSGNRNSVFLTVQFSEEWAGYQRSAVFFTYANAAVFEVLLTDDACVVPSEVLANTAALFIGVRGVADSDPATVKVSTLVTYKVEKGAPAGTDSTAEPPPGVYQQILAKMNSVAADAEAVNKALELVTNFEKRVSNGELDGEDGGYYTPNVSQTGENTMRVSFAASKEGMAAVEDQTITLPAGKDGVVTVAGAAAGQIVQISEVDENGIPTAWRPVDMPSGGEWELIGEVTSDGTGTSVGIGIEVDFTGYRQIHAEACDTANSAITYRVVLSSSMAAWSNGYVINSYARSEKVLHTLHIDNIDGSLKVLYSASSGYAGGTVSAFYYNNPRFSIPATNNKYIRMDTNNNADYRAVPEGCTLKVWGLK